MPELTVREMLEMQKRLQEKYKDKWTPLGPATAKNQLLWMLGECGEVIDILKKQGGEAVTVPGPVREHFIEEMADVLMYYHDILLCCGISADELRDSYIKKHETNMNRW